MGVYWGPQQWWKRLQPPPSGIVTNGLVLNLDAGNPASYSGSGTTWYDLTSNGNNVTLVNGVGYDSANQGSLVFDGVNDYADFFAPDLGNIVTVEMWCKVGPNPANNMFFGWDVYDVWFNPFDSNGSFGFNTGDASLYGINSSDASNLNLIGNWKHYIFVMRSDVSYTNNKIYVNAVSQNLSQLLGSESSENRNFNSGQGRISGWRHTLEYRLQMNCSVFRVYNRELTQQEVTQNYNALKSRYDPIVTSGLILNLDAGNPASYSGSGTTWYDLSGNSNNGTLVNGVSYDSANGGSLVFNGSTYIDITNLSDFEFGTGDYTVDCWFKLTTNTGGYQMLFNQVYNTSKGNQIRFGDAGFGSVLQCGPDMSTFAGCWSSTYNQNNSIGLFFNVALRRNSGVCSFWVNAVKQLMSQGLSTVTEYDFTDNTSVSLTDYIHLGDGFVGNIYSTKVYNRALTDQEITQNYNAIKNRYI